MLFSVLGRCSHQFPPGFACPDVTLPWGPPGNLCDSLFACHPNEVCCNDGNGCSCTAPARRGSCPVINPNDPPPSQCGQRCKNDVDCPTEGQKCCDNGCGYTSCADPVSPRPGMCPTVTFTATCPASPMHACFNDDDCPGSADKCCNDGSCGTQCVAPGELLISYVIYLAFYMRVRVY